MKLSLRSKLTASYMMIVLICVGVISILSNAVFETQFRKYIINKQENDAKNVVSLINQRLIESGGLDMSFLNTIGMNALEKGMIVKIKDRDDNTVWDASEHNYGMCQQMLSNMRRNMQGYYDVDEGGYVEKKYSLEGSGQVIGTVVIGYYGPYFYTDSDLYFLQAINNLLIWTGAGSLLLALALGILMSNQLTKPIRKVIKRANKIAEGNFDRKEPVKTNTIEMIQLSTTIDNLADNLKRQQQISRQMSSDIAHELRTPLTTIQGNLEAVIDGVMDLDKHRVGILHDEILRINRLVDDLGKLAHFENHNIILQKESFDLSDKVYQLVKNFENDFIKQNKNIAFEGTKSVVLADKDKISQAIVNLISNALKFTEHSGNVLVKVEESEQEVLVKIKDDGIGIDKEELENIFHRFYRVDKSRTRASGGSGIGLAIVKFIIELHNGKVKVESEKSKGSEFILSLPKD